MPTSHLVGMSRNAFSGSPKPPIFQQKLVFWPSETASISRTNYLEAETILASGRKQGLGQPAELRRKTA